MASTFLEGVTMGVIQYFPCLFLLFYMVFAWLLDKSQMETWDKQIEKWREEEREEERRHES